VTRSGWSVVLPLTPSLLRTAIFVLHHDLLMGFAAALGRSKVKFDCKYFSPCEELLELFAVCCSVFVGRTMRKYASTLREFVATHNSSHPQLCSMLACYELLVLPYFAFRSVLRDGGDAILGRDDGATFVRQVTYWLPLFLATNAHNYALVTLRFVYNLEALLPSVRRVVLASLSQSVSGRPHSCQQLDELTERVRGVRAGDGVHSCEHVVHLLACLVRALQCRASAAICVELFVATYMCLLCCCRRWST
jgi:hypothetical protein